MLFTFKRHLEPYKRLWETLRYDSASRELIYTTVPVFMVVHDFGKINGLFFRSKGNLQGQSRTRSSCYSDTSPFSAKVALSLRLGNEVDFGNHEKQSNYSGSS